MFQRHGNGSKSQKAMMDSLSSSPTASGQHEQQQGKQMSQLEQRGKPFAMQITLLFSLLAFFRLVLKYARDVEKN